MFSTLKSTVLIFLFCCSGVILQLKFIHVEPKDHSSGLFCLKEVGSVFFFSNEKFTRTPNLLLTHISNMSSPAANIQLQYIKMMNSIQFNNAEIIYLIRVISDSVHLKTLTTERNRIVSHDYYVIIVDGLRNLKNILRNSISKSPAWNPGGRFLILYNNVANRNSSTKTAEDIFGYMLNNLYVSRVVLLYATNSTAYDVLLMGYFNTKHCRQAVPIKVTSCNSGKLANVVSLKYNLVVRPTLKNCTFTLCSKISAPFVEEDCIQGIELTMITVIRRRMDFTISTLSNWGNTSIHQFLVIVTAYSKEANFQPNKFDGTLVFIEEQFSNNLLPVNLSRQIKIDSKDIFIPCAMNGQYDLILSSKLKGTIKIEASDKHPSANWPLLNRSIPIRVRYQNRMQKKQMILKWSKSKLDIHVMHYCVVVNTKSPQESFCQAVRNSMNNSTKNQGRTCIVTSPMDNAWFKQRERIKKIDPSSTNVVCTGPKSQQVLKGLQPNTKYFIDIFGVHTKLRNLTFLLKATTVWFNRTHPNQLKENVLTVEKISGMTSVSIFSFKVPVSTQAVEELRYLILPCGGSQVDVKFLKQRQKVFLEKDIYKPYYITIKDVKPGDRHIVRISPSNEDEILKANKVGIAVTTKGDFPNLPTLPLNTSLFEIRSFRNCGSTTIAWYSAPEMRKFSYCIIVFNIPNNNRSSADQTNYCMDFGKKVRRHPQFFSTNCFEPDEPKKIEKIELLNLTPGDSYLVYVTMNLVEGKSLPYQSLKINTNKHCHNELDDVLWSNNSSYYDN